ncbi:MAG TPA: hemerythrin domain-containing protein [Polyangiaceae bacterium]|nr:hemerythrin domain-containing protein [Polyangiaceae bacterium]
MNALELLNSQHEEVKALFEEIEETDDPEDKAGLFEELAASIAAHATIEEKIFYPAAYANATKELLSEAVEEHLAAKRILADLLKMSVEDGQFHAKLKVLKDELEHHIEEEEGELFPKVREELDAAKLEALGAQMEDLFDSELDDGAAEKIPLELERAASIKPAKSAKAPKAPKAPKRQPARQ